MDYTSIANQIIAMYQKDTEHRNLLVASAKLGDGYNEEMKKIHLQNAHQLKEIIDTIGYPTIEKVGTEASVAAWMIVQHAIELPTFMKSCFLLLEIETQNKKVNPLHLAYLTDRIAVFEEKKQLYGTQFDWDENGQLSPNAFDDILLVNERRKKIGLNSLENQIEIMRLQAEKEKHFCPPDFEKRKKEMQDWKKKVGWIK